MAFPSLLPGRIPLPLASAGHKNGKPLYGAFSVGDLGSLITGNGDKPGREVYSAYGRLRGVDMLTTGTGTTHGFNTDIPVGKSYS
jgi:hypothetical protein